MKPALLKRASTPKNEAFTVDLSYPKMKFAEPDVDPPFLLAVKEPDFTADLRLRNNL